ncbi:PE family protein [Mycobacterium tuberculosis]|nr:PE family protein [Mycobacterium tuberculosis]
MVDFGALPPEINSARMYAGPGSASLVAAAKMWDSVASDLFSAASAFQSVVWGLTVGSWIGSSAGLMAAAASPYVAWMSVTAGQAQLTAAQVRVAAAAYETAYGLTVPPPVIAENRTELMTLTATNLLGQNTPAIEANQAAYSQMWGQDAEAMYGYAATAATATEALLPFEDAPLITNPGGLLEQAVAVEEAIDTAAANQLMNNVPQALQQLAQPAQGVVPSSKLGGLWTAVSPHLSPLSNVSSIANNHMSMMGTGVSMTNTLHSMLKGLAPAAAQAVETAAENGVWAMSSLGSQLGSSLGSSGLGAGVAANLGRAASVGSLSVPPAWAAANQAVTPAARALPLTSLTSAAQTAPGHMLGSWIGSSAGLMVAAASPYVAWMSVTAGQAELTAAQVRVAAAAYETAYGLTVPPPVIAENRAELMILIATNLLGQNTPAIAVNEAEYGEMWAQDAAAMFGYAATAATATEALLPFEDAPLITNPGGLLEQAVAVEEAIDTAAANQLMNNVPQALQQLAQPTKSIWPFDQLSELWKAISPHLSPLSNIVSMLNNHVSMTNSGVSMASTLHSMLKGFAPAAAQAVETAAQNGVQAMSSLGSQLGSSLGSSGLGAGVAANLGRAASVGSLSVPQAWAAANQAVTPAARALPLTSLTSAAQTAPGHMLGGLPLGHSVNAGSGINNALRVPARAYAILRTPAAG